MQAMQSLSLPSPGAVFAAVGTASALCLGMRWGLHLLRNKPKPNTLSIEMSGLPPKKGTPMVIMLSGFPDDHGSFTEVLSQLSSSYSVVTLCMPDYDTKSLQQYWGYSFKQIVDMMESAVAKVVPEGSKACLVAHDWGAFIAQQYIRRPVALQYVDRFLLMDIGPSVEKTLTNAIAIPLYQWYLAISFLLGRITFDIFGDIMMALFPWGLLGPCPNEPKVPPRTSGRPGSRMAYPYLRLQLALLFRTESLTKSADLAPGKKPYPVPTTFIYGKNKRAKFHTDAFLDIMEKTEGMSYKELDCGHFIQSQLPGEVVKAIQALRA